MDTRVHFGGLWSFCKLVHHLIGHVANDLADGTHVMVNSSGVLTVWQRELALPTLHRITLT